MKRQMEEEKQHHQWLSGEITSTQGHTHTHARIIFISIEQAFSWIYSMQYQDPVHALANVDKDLKIRTTAHKSICIKATELCLIDLEERKSKENTYLYKQQSLLHHLNINVYSLWMISFVYFLPSPLFDSIFSKKKKCKSYRVEKDKI